MIDGSYSFAEAAARQKVDAERIAAGQRISRYRVVLERAGLYADTEEWTDLTLGEAAIRVDDLTGVGADTVLMDVDELGELPWRWDDDEAGREVMLRAEDPPEAGDMSTSDGLGA